MYLAEMARISRPRGTVRSVKATKSGRPAAMKRPSGAERLGAGGHTRHAPKQCLNLGDGHAVLLAFGVVAVNPVEPGDGQLHTREVWAEVYTFVNHPAHSRNAIRP